MAVTLKDPKILVQHAIERHGAGRDELIPILQEINRDLGHLPVEVLAEISSRMKIPESQVMSVASFYDMLSTKPRGKHVIKFCESAPCHVVGGREVWEGLQKALKIKPGETTPDGMWTLLTTSCLGVCAVGPVILIDDDIYGNVDPSKIPQILSRYS